MTLVSKPRIVWVDVVRGMAAVAVVLTHVLERLSLEDQISFRFGEGSSFGDLVRMQTMIFIAGFFVLPSLKKGTAAFAESKASRILWPLLLWSPIYYYIWMRIGLFPELTDPLGVGLKLVFKPILHLWFLQHLLVFFALSWLLFRDGASYRKLVLTTLIIAIPALLLGSLGPSAFDGLLATKVGPYINDIKNVSDRLARFGTLMLFFNLGVAARMIGAEAINDFIKPRALIIATVSILIVALSSHFVIMPKYTVSAAPSSLVGIIAFISTAILIERVSKLRALLVDIGKYSLEIYILHLMVVLFLQRTIVEFLTPLGQTFTVAAMAILTTAICIGVATVSRGFLGNIAFQLPEGRFNRVRVSK